VRQLTAFVSSRSFQIRGIRVNRTAIQFLFLSLVVTTAAAQEGVSSLPDAPKSNLSNSHLPASPVYSPPTQSERLKRYAVTTYGPIPIAEAAIRGGIQQHRDAPSGWPQEGQGYADRFGSAMGEIAVRGTTDWVFSEIFKEDLRVSPCHCAESKFHLALADTFTARKGEDGHRVLSVARLLGPASGGLVANYTWYPADTSRGEVGTEVGLSYGFVFLTNLVRESLHH
jgi:hypothetical protein